MYNIWALHYILECIVLEYKRSFTLLRFCFVFFFVFLWFFSYFFIYLLFFEVLSNWWGFFKKNKLVLII